MTKLQKNAKTLDSFLSFMLKLNLVAAALLAVGFCVLWIMHWVSPESIRMNASGLNFGMIKFTVDPGIPRDPNAFILQLTALSLYLLASMVVFVMIIRCGKKILAPMTEGIPFRSHMAGQLKQLAWLTIALGLVDNLGKYALYGNLIPGYDLNALFSGPGILEYHTDYPWNLTFVYSSAILFLLSYVFAQGAELQQLSDETL